MEPRRMEHTRILYSKYPNTGSHRHALASSCRDGNRLETRRARNEEYRRQTMNGDGGCGGGSGNELVLVAYLQYRPRFQHPSKSNPPSHDRITSVYAKHVDATSPPDSFVHRVDPGSENVQKSHEPPSGEWSRAWTRIKEYEHKDGEKD
ncbi:hypothetical protein BDQ12DRAFT_669668 [Crucibulum laeve]|uniref:Uncharacterized protein n=1 Tax=Crucibulum laeve TaxID=68775 RepID=A0A5C3LMT8_9AGAR|nr:hypothetical protein BDQ12DRAFT_669668 [Crucibulum laeve]